MDSNAESKTSPHAGSDRTTTRDPVTLFVEVARKAVIALDLTEAVDPEELVLDTTGAPDADKDADSSKQA